MRALLKISTFLGLTVILFVPILNNAGAVTDMSSLGTPTIIASPTSGPPGAPISITISNLPDISKVPYPYPDLYVYIPFSKSFGSGIQNQCGGMDCFAVYTYTDSQKQNMAVRTINFTLFSVNNPSPVYLNGQENSVCDLIMNGQTEVRYSTLCNTKDIPAGVYNIVFAWVLESDPAQKYIVKTIPFTVTPAVPLNLPPVPNPADKMIKEYQNGTISQSQLESGLMGLGWNDEQIREAEAETGKLSRSDSQTVPEFPLSTMAITIATISSMAIVAWFGNKLTR